MKPTDRLLPSWNNNTPNFLVISVFFINKFFFAIKDTCASSPRLLNIIVVQVKILLNVNYETSISIRLYTMNIIYQTLLSLWRLMVSRDFSRFSPLQNVVKSKWEKLVRVTDMNIFCLVSIKSQPKLLFQYSISRNVTTFNSQSLLLVRHSALRHN